MPQLDDRQKRSEFLGSITLEKRSAALFFDNVDGKFTLVEKVVDQEEAVVFDAVPRQQWGRNVLLFGHTTSRGGFIAGGHGSLTGKVFYVKLTSGCHYRFEVDPKLPCLVALYVEPPAKKDTRASGPLTFNKRNQIQPRPSNSNIASKRAPRKPSTPAGHSDEHEDFSAEDLRRLRGEAPMHSKKRSY